MNKLTPLRRAGAAAGSPAGRVAGKPKACAGMRAQEWTVAIVLALICWVLIALAIMSLSCAARYDDYLAVRFSAFNEAVQDGLADCRADPNACRPTLELMAAEMQTWTELLTDPNL